MVTKVNIFDVTELGFTSPLIHLLGKAMQQSLTCQVICTDETQLASLDKSLWLSGKSFLPHCSAADYQDDCCPIILTSGLSSPLRADILIDCEARRRSKEELQQFTSYLALVKTATDAKSNSLQKIIAYYLRVTNNVKGYLFKNGKWERVFCDETEQQNS